ncbi:hypothetical protein CAEBREN_01180 [Caenorhabditis brenneri]|uniref:SCP domain-containing protein n=1 Tax=Caenorhabditis brenneri TaxID=135651 RepID=G0MCV7_CAEBE|nr:hypothetical protein CAEBREN_01180 [Caenorhabditis brenneri]
MKIQQHLLEISSLWVLILLLNFALGDDELITEEEHLRLINQFRRDFAKKFNVANMHELKFDKNLRDIAENAVITYIDWNSDRYKTWRYTIFSSYWNQKNFNTLFDSLLMQSEKEILETIIQREDSTDLAKQDHEFIIPGQKAIGCAVKDGRISPTTHGEQRAVMLCLFGPEGYLATFYEARGPPGSKCDEGYHNKDGLCGL